MATVSVVLLQCNLSYMTKVALDSIAESEFKASEILVVDNGSPEEDKAWARNRSDLVLIESPVNLGYCGGTNLGWRRATSDYILLCNNDIALSKPCIGNMVEAMNANPKIGWLSACYQSGPWSQCQVEFPAHVGAKLDASQGQDREEMNQFATSLKEHNVVEYYNVTEGTVIMVRKAASDEAGLYQDALRWHHTHDYSIRLRRLGWQVAVCRNAVFWHNVDHPTVAKFIPEIFKDAFTHQRTWVEAEKLMVEYWGSDWSGKYFS